MNLLSATLEMVGGLATTLVGFLAVFYLAKKTLKSGQEKPRKSLLRILGHLPLGMKKSIFLVEVLGQKLVLSVAGENITLLTKIKDNQIPDEFEKETPGKRLSPRLALLLSKNKNNNDEEL